MKQRTTIWLDEEDRAAVEKLKRRYKLRSTSAVLSFALHTEAQRIATDVSEERGRHAQSAPDTASGSD